MAAFSQLWNQLRDRGNPAPYLLIDCAGLPGGRADIPDAIFQQVECLFTGELSVELADVGPYLGRLQSYDPGVTDAVDELLLAHVAIVAFARDRPGPDLSFSDVHRHFRKLNVVYGPKGEPLFFRYYDPRVLLDVLAVLEPAQLDAFFGPVESIAFADAQGVLVRCSSRDGKLAVARSAGAAG